MTNDKSKIKNDFPFKNPAKFADLNLDSRSLAFGLDVRGRQVIFLPHFFSVEESDYYRAGRRLMWKGLVRVFCMLLAVVWLYGCQTSNTLKPLPEPEVLNTPPPNDPRFSQPVEYPGSVLYQDLQNKKVAPFQGGGGRSPGMGRPGGGVGGY
jgi:hypothetical protein